MATGDTHFESEGASIPVALTATVTAAQVAYADGWLGITAARGESGETVALAIAHEEFQFVVPAGLAVSKGNTVYITVANVTGHTPADNAYSTTSGAGKLPLFRATSDKDANNVVTGILIVKGA